MKGYMWMCVRILSGFAYWKVCIVGPLSSIALVSSARGQIDVPIDREWALRMMKGPRRGPTRGAESHRRNNGAFVQRSAPDDAESARSGPPTRGLTLSTHLCESIKSFTF